MTDRLAPRDEDARTKLPIWLQCIVAVIGAAMLVGPAATVARYR